MRLAASQYEVQRLVDREATSSYYTSPDGVEVVRALLSQLPEQSRQGVVLADPFMGSGVLLTAVDDLVRPSKVVGFEINEAPCNLGRRLVAEAYPGAEVDVRCGDAFELGWRLRGSVDLVVTNPPFVRWLRLPKSYREGLLERFEAAGYGPYISRRDPGLHILGLLLVDRMLRDGGVAVSVLPASTFYTEQGEGLKRFLKLRYDVAAIVENGRAPSFSDGSGFKELIVLLRKRRPFEPPSGSTAVYRYAGSLERLYDVSLRGLPRLLDRNWLSLFKPGAVELARALEEGVKSGRLRYLRRGEVVRGVEMYGPDFFFLPNRYWSVARESDGAVVLSNVGSGDEVELPKKYLVPCLRRPGDYRSPVVEDPGYYALAVPPGVRLEGGLRAYVEWGLRSGAAAPAVKAFGSGWLSHIWRQLRAKEPFGHVFIRDKLDLARDDVVAYYSPRPLCATKDFYVIRGGGRELAEWYNSETFRAVLAAFGRDISSTWTRFVESDLLAVPVPSPRAATEVQAIIPPGPPHH